MPERKDVQLQGPRPAALKITKDSHKIKKPPLPPPHRPVIIYTVSPKIIHTEPTEFKDLVQRLTGCRPSSSNDALDHPSDTTISSMSMSMPMSTDQGVERVGHGILSPTPGLLPPISPNIFTPPPLPPQTTMPAVADLSPFTHFFQDLSPIATNHFSSSLDFFQQNFPDFH